MVKNLIADVSAIFLLPVFEKSVIFNDFRAILHSIIAREGGNTVCWKAMARRRHSMTVWRIGQTPPKIDSALQASPLGPKFGLGPSGLSICLFWQLSMKTQPKYRLGPACLAFRASQNAPAPTFSLVRCLRHGLGRATLDSDHAECSYKVRKKLLSCR